MSTAQASSKTYHFISGLPRSGSTLLSAILRQNPRFHAGMTSPIGGLFNNIIGAVSAGSELAAMVNTEQRKRLLRGLFDSYYADLPASTEVVFDTNRAWTASLAPLVELFPESKVLCCVRNVAWVIDSLERQYQSNAFENTRLFSTPADRATVYTRTEALAKHTGMVGFAWAALQGAVYGPQADRLLLIDYDFLVRQPGDVIKLIYKFLGEEPFEHDFDNVEYDAPGFDEQLGVTGLHKVHRKVEPRPRKTILPPDLFDKYGRMNFWQNIKGSRAQGIVANRKDPSHKK